MTDDTKQKPVKDWFKELDVIIPSKVFGEGGLPEEGEAKIVGETTTDYIINCKFPDKDGKGLRPARIAVAKTLVPMIIAYTSDIVTPRIDKIIVP